MTNDTAVRIGFTVHGDPVAQPRAKATTIGGKPRMYTPGKKITPFKQAVAAAYIAAGGTVLDGPIELHIACVFSRPKSKTKKRGRNEREWKTTRPDVDNIQKAVQDALNGIAYRDDSQIALVTAGKVIAAADEPACTEIVIRTMQ